MADFKTHITTSTLLGVGYGAVGVLFWEMSLDHAMVAAGLCSVSGMLPDLDSDSGVPVRETTAFSAAVVPMLMLERFQDLALTREQMVLAAGLMYIAVRFGVAEVFKRYTVHRGMWHSIPAMMSVGLLAFLICSSHDFNVRVYKSAAVVLGFLSHLVLDELWSVDLQGRAIPRLKKSSGTALKFFSKSSWANISTYGKLSLLMLLVAGDPIMMDRYGYPETVAPRAARRFIKDVFDKAEQPVIRR
ncbi:metal-dependent hydrolase [Lignipirellula cremea]|uniref:Inner membrane protein n=1 Tax=Lignipirellula cremea TaxID=2528010 RepID=A0A518E2X6_9BACT|nr:metal-dependent hydrolase [Lignipirellula cremea]QDU98450.1 hypothetical protein Pla8534_63180 [Lignipirellula cremea]